jgi:hypothetical protein
MLNIAAEALGLRKSEWAFYLGSNWRKWTPYHISKLKKLIQKRIDLLSRDGRKVSFCKPMLDGWRQALRDIENAENFERDLVKSYRKISLSVLRDLALTNETTPSNLEKAMRSSGWKRVKEQGKVFWVQK